MSVQPLRGRGAATRISGLGLLIIALCCSAVLLGVAIPATGKEAWYSGALALALTTGAALALRGAPVTGALSALFVGAGAGQLWLLESGYFFYVRLVPDTAPGAFALATIAVQGLVSAALLLRARARVRPVLAALGIGRLAAVAAACTLLSAPILAFAFRDAWASYAEHLVAGGIYGLAAALNLGALIAAPDLMRALPGPARRAALGRALPIVLPLAVLAVSAALSLHVFDGAAIVEDETAYLFQARTFAGGHLAGPALPPEATGRFDYYLLSQGADGWYAVTAPGWPAVLAIGVALGVPWLVGPMLGAIAVACGIALVRRLTRDETERLAASVLMAAAPMQLLLSASLMTHALSLALIFGGWLLCAIAGGRMAEGRGALVPAVLAGLLMGWLFLTRALEGVTIGTLTGLWLLVTAWPQRRIGPVVGYALGCLATGSLFFLFNWALTGAPLVSPQGRYLAELWGPRANAFGFGPDIGPPSGWGALDLWTGHSPLEALINTVNGLSYLGLDLFGWTFSSLLPILLGLALGLRSGLRRMMLLVAVAIVGLHALYWFTATFYIGPRYWYAAFPAFVVLAAAGIARAVERTAPVAPQAAQRLGFALCLAAAFGATVFTGWRSVTRFVPRGHLHAEMMQAVDRVVAETGDRHLLILMPCKPALRATMIENDALQRPDHLLFALDADAVSNAALARSLGDRRPVSIPASELPATACRDAEDGLAG